MGLYTLREGERRWRSVAAELRRLWLASAQGTLRVPKLPVPSQIWIFPTKSYAYLEPALQARLNRQKDGLYLYRNIFPTQVRDLCFIGAETSTFNNILTQGLQSLWLRRVLSGKMNLPSTDTMEATVAQDKAWKHSWMPKKGDRAAILQLKKMKYPDQLL